MIVSRNAYCYFNNSEEIKILVAAKKFVPLTFLISNSTVQQFRIQHTNYCIIIRAERVVYLGKQDSNSLKIIDNIYYYYNWWQPRYSLNFLIISIGSFVKQWCSEKRLV